MDKNNIITIIAVVVLIGAVLFSFDYSTTGKVVDSQDKLIITPSIVKAGNYVTVEVVPSLRGINRGIKLFDSSDLRVAQLKMQDCNSFRCMKSATTTYKLSTDLSPGVYYFKYFDYNTQTFEKSFFTIE